MALVLDLLPGLMGPIARELLGEPNRAMSSKNELRYGNHGSLSVDLLKGTWFDHESGAGGGVVDLVTRQTGLRSQEREGWISERYPDVVERKSNGARPSPLGKQVAWYDYVDEAGSLLFQVVRFEPKTFRQRRRDEHGEWSWSVRGVRQVPYRLPELIEATGALMFVVEGEKDVDNLRTLGAPASCNAGGAGKWPESLNEFFRDADVVVIADNDPQAKDANGVLRFHEDGRPVYPGQDHARAVCAQLATVATHVRYLDLKSAWPECPLKGDISDWIARGGGTIEHLYEIAEHAPAWSPELPGPTVRAFEPISTYRDAAAIPPRRWLYAKQYIRGTVTATVADGGTGKTILAIAEGIAIATGRNILGVEVPEAVNVLYWNGEEPIDEIERRVHAVCQHFRVDVQSLAGKFFMMSGLVFPITIAQMAHGTIAFDEPTAMVVEQSLTRLNIGLFLLDPFVACHRIPESDNTSIDAVVKRFMGMAYRTQAALELIHHTRKPQQNGGGDMSIADTRGASALVNAARVARVLNRMTETQARQAGVTDHRQFFRADNGKANYAPAQLATWFKLCPESLANGDSVAALEHFNFPGAFDNVKIEDIETVRSMVGSDGACKYDSRSPDWVGHIVAQVLDLDPQDHKKKLQTIIDTWIKNGQLYKNKRRDEQRRKVFFVDNRNLDEDGHEPSQPAEPELFDER